MDITLPILILAIPITMFLVLGIGGVKMSKKMAGILGIIGMGTTATIAYTVAITYFFSGDANFIIDGVRQQYQVFDFTWLSFTDTLVVKLGFLLDPISAMMLVVITTISFMVHLYSWGYMEGEQGFQRYYAFLSLFSFSMLGLVVATNIFQMYIFWELVGVSSYLLIGFYYKLPSAVSASKKAFIVTRFADLGFLIGILLLSFYTDTFNFMDLTSNPERVLASTGGASFMGASVLTWAMVLIFTGGMGKSAMMPLHIWLPDAMEGPTPVSALIHAATMVVAGVYLVARMFPVYCVVDAAMTFICCVGAITAFYAAVVACAQIDIKRILAFSTISQIAFMMVSLGVAYDKPIEGVHYSGLGYMAGMFHLFTHAMFKALLFLGAGALIHAVHSNNYTAMGGLRKYMPITHWTFLIGCLAIAGIWPFAGFFSKDEMLAAMFARHWFWGAWMTMVAGLTAFYMFRMYFLVFWWEENPHYKEHKPHDAPWQMSVPLLFLAAVSCVCGWALPFGELVTWNGEPYHIHIEWVKVAIPSILTACVAIALAYVMYHKKNDLPTKVKNFWPTLWTAANRRFYWDEIYMFITHKIIFNIICKSIAWFDRHVIDATMDGFAKITQKASYAIRGMQAGTIQAYVAWYLAGAVALAAITWICLI
ncbi:NADH-quinone oxidoreductase subunit L [Lepagella muris]|jgi:NADH-quinone oxidoreductase subunit L|uniref:NADH-quinone oxidoreductase subunit L n=1 Tax=Lepagella muris TaxID=3032870 RepID=A0AC61RDR7_9BACT|nr:NADH-quinone oxidoreductase subunit L [Lepagella muris]ROT05558.1 NADH-quinone oxidoreductase subunit L [Muribaculaceae bacterium Isolate-037 (Harlan)]TGY78048.1 NADH-quinone oxidoreductase subunit L [Lepagella muris]THG51607.1 NADH-quinone oxidoreductase subunit L [Bacteroidales bacterium]TKC63263.1 NADH-quinone oxidoreductase subunit L [Bacteroidales bacterium]